MPWTRVAPSSPVARSPVIVMANDHTKEEMDEMLGEAMTERGIDPKRTRIGWDIVCRVGNPCKIHDLVRVNAHNATSIIAMMTEKDEEEEEESDGRVKNGATIRTILALRNVVMGNRNAQHLLESDLGIAASSSASATHAFCETPGLQSFPEAARRSCLRSRCRGGEYLISLSPHRTACSYAYITVRARARGGVDFHRLWHQEAGGLRNLDQSSSVAFK